MMFSCLRLSRILISLKVLWIGIISVYHCHHVKRESCLKNNQLKVLSDVNYLKWRYIRQFSPQKVRNRFWYISEISESAAKSGSFFWPEENSDHEEARNWNLWLKLGKVFHAKRKLKKIKKSLRICFKQ